MSDYVATFNKLNTTFQQRMKRVEYGVNDNDKHESSPKSPVGASDRKLMKKKK